MTGLKEIGRNLNAMRECRLSLFSSYSVICIFKSRGFEIVFILTGKEIIVSVFNK